MMENQTSSSFPVVALLTDFGLRDGFVGAMKGVILSHAPTAKIVDISHEIEPFDVASAAFLLDWSVPYFPVGTVFQVVVDPGVGTQRDILVLEAFKRRFVFPDNGVISQVWSRVGENKQLVRATNRSLWLDAVSSTFHGRDIFAPLAAFLANGGDLDEIGPTIQQPGVLLPQPRCEFGDSHVQGEIVYIDRFCNLVTTIERGPLLTWIEEHNLNHRNVAIHVGSTKLKGIAGGYGDVAQGSPVAVFDGYDRLEIAVNQERADRSLGARIGDRVTVRAS